jgi:predicted deacylase
MPSGTEVTTTVHTYDGDAGGPTVYVQAAQHGREVNGTEMCRRLHAELLGRSLAGRVVVVPVADPLTFDRVSYTTPEALDSVNANMNRVWPGDASGTLHERMAARLWEYVETADAIVDLHTGSPDMLTHVVFREGDAESRALAEAFGTDLLLSEEAGEDADAEWRDRDFDGKLRVAATRADVPAVTPELSHNKQVVEGAVEAGVDGTLNVLRHCGVLDADPVDTGAATLARNHLGTVAAAESGLFVPDTNRALGEHVDAGERVGTLYDPATYETLQTVETDRAGVLYSLTKEATVTAGESLVKVALLRE